ncbi:outer membrane factor lipoprotein domain-containing protein [Methylocaldum gracile]|uniref:hypothetical protein n=1 Tax=Methylocaldum sp. 0917 TaxID=2485163 RepID=UPI001B744C89
MRAKAQAETTEAQIPTLEAGKTAALRQLEALTGQQPGALAAGLDAPGPFPEAPGQAMLASPADTIRHRPDLRAAERQLAAATAMQGAAIAELFPKISLSAFLGLRNTVSVRRAPSRRVERLRRHWCERTHGVSAHS